MKGGGGLTWAGWLMVGVGGLLVYAGMTGQSLVSELQSVLSGKSPASTLTPAPATPGSSGASGFAPGTGVGDGAGGSASTTPKRPGATVPPDTPRVPTGSSSW